MIGGCCAFLIFANLVLALGNNQLNRQIVAAQSEINRTQVVQNTMQNLVSRVAQDAEKEIVLRDLLVKYRFILPAGPSAAVPDASP